MIADALKLTTYFRERERAGGRFLADALSDVYARHGVATSLTLRGIVGYGANRHLRTDRQLTLSEDLPVVSLAVDASERIEAVATELERFSYGGALTLERARMLTGRVEPVVLDEPTKLTVYVGRQQRVGGAHAFRAVVNHLHASGVAGASVLLGVDGTAHGTRQRARFFARNADVPLMVIAVGDGDAIAAALPRLGEMLPNPLLTLERVTVCKRDGIALAYPEQRPDGWQKLMIYASEQAQYDGKPLYMELVQRLRAAGAAGATSLRGIWGYHGEHVPHGDTLWQLRRRVPVLTVVVDGVERTRRWFEIVDEMTAETGLVTCEYVPRFQPRAAS